MIGNRGVIELVKAAIAREFCSNPHQQIMDADFKYGGRMEYGFADSLIKKLKGDWNNVKRRNIKAIRFERYARFYYFGIYRGFFMLV